jgi:uncharacterized membrane protein (UPF0127 family)
MRKVIILVILLVINIPYLSGEDINKVYIGNTCIRVDIVDSGREREQGLMFRDGLDEDQGMLFIFEKEGKYCFWMKNMNFPLDIIWINRDNKIVDIKKNVPCSQDNLEVLVPNDSAIYVLEVNAGFADKNKIEIGDRISF